MLIAEMACAHDGSIDNAKKILEAFAETGVDAIQYQIWGAEELLSPSRSDYQKIKELQINLHDWKALLEFHRSCYENLQISIFVYDMLGASFAEDLQPDFIKFNSSDLTNPLLLDWVACSRLPLNLSWGGSSLGEVEWALERLVRNGYDINLVTLMNGIQSFPSEPNQAQLLIGKRVADLFGLKAGYQDHSPGGSKTAFMLNAAALSLGYSVLETHVCYSRMDTNTDFQSAFEPEEMIELKIKLDEVLVALNSNNFSVDDDKVEKYRLFQKKYLCAAADLEAGQEIARTDLRLLRTDRVGISGKHLDEVIGKIAKTRINKGQMLEKGSIC